MTGKTKATAQYRASGIGRKHPIGNHYADGERNAGNAVKNEPGHASWYAVQAWSQARGRYSDWPPYRAYQLGFARVARRAAGMGG